MFESLVLYWGFVCDTLNHTTPTGWRHQGTVLCMISIGSIPQCIGLLGSSPNTHILYCLLSVDYYTILKKLGVQIKRWFHCNLLGFSQPHFSVLIKRFNGIHYIQINLSVWGKIYKWIRNNSTNITTTTTVLLHAWVNVTAKKTIYTSNNFIIEISMCHHVVFLLRYFISLFFIVIYFCFLKSMLKWR